MVIFKRLSIIKHLNVSDLTKKNSKLEKEIFCDFWAPMPPPKGVPISRLLGHFLKIASMSPLI